jgi:HEAT repeat protein
MMSIAASELRERRAGLSLVSSHFVRTLAVRGVLVSCAVAAIAVSAVSAHAGEKGAWIRPERQPASTTVDADPNDPYTKLDIQHWLEELSSSDYLKRIAAADALGQLKVRQALRPLMARLQQDPDAGVRASAAEALGKLGDPVAVNALIEALQLPAVDIHSEIVPPAAARALGHIGDQAAVPALSRAMGGAGDIQFAAAEALEMIKSPAARAVLSARDERIAQQCIAKLSNAKASTREQACIDLRSLGVKSAAGPLVKTLSDPDASVRSAAARAIGATGDSLATDGLLRLLNDANAGVRVAAAEALAILPPPAQVIPTAPAALLSALADKDARVRSAAATLLEKWRCAGAVPSLVLALENPGERAEVRVAACAALARFQDRAAEEGLSNALAKGLPAVREEAALQFGRRGDGRGNDVLTALVRNSKANPSRRVEAIGLLSHLNEQRAVSALNAASHDQTLEVREAASQALSRLRTSTSAPAPS